MYVDQTQGFMGIFSSAKSAAAAAAESGSKTLKKGVDTLNYKNTLKIPNYAGKIEMVFEDFVKKYENKAAKLLKRRDSAKDEATREGVNREIEKLSAELKVLDVQQQQLFDKKTYTTKIDLLTKRLQEAQVKADEIAQKMQERIGAVIQSLETLQ